MKGDRHFSISKITAIRVEDSLVFLRDPPSCCMTLCILHLIPATVARFTNVLTQSDLEIGPNQQPRLKSPTKVESGFWWGRHRVSRQFPQSQRIDLLGALILFTFGVWLSKTSQCSSAALPVQTRNANSGCVNKHLRNGLPLTSEMCTKPGSLSNKSSCESVLHGTAGDVLEISHEGIDRNRLEQVEDHQPDTEVPWGGGGGWNQSILFI